MHATLFVNLPVADVARSRAFFTALGYGFHESMCSDVTLVVVLGHNQFAMLLQRDVFDSLHPAQTADAAVVKECVICLGVDTRDAVDALVDRAIAAGATAGDSEDEEFMYGRSYNDLDGHSWQIFWLDPAAVSAEPSELAAPQR
ncbi:glyoxalase [Mycobacterium sp. MYCO198283]|uniref:VOC family protein n=1 Tax=Mycobacterium sp. MYCO198283 TaxID=2883505 RepID=UPI001E5E9EE9|nr:glyoxalase [Mycobacterium sp. MYCO198283]MCG5434345.1 glyoxalase [Mycobacterium sp. MYCO198283]